MSDNRYGGLLDKPMKTDTTAMDAVNRFRDAVNKQKQGELDYLAKQIGNEYEFLYESEHIITKEELGKI